MSHPQNNFHETVEHYQAQINEIEFDFSLLSCGSYSHFIGEHIKNINKQSIYIGGILPLYFGIFGDLYINNAGAFWFDVAYCTLNIFNIAHSKRTIESCNSYLFNEYKYGDILSTFNFKGEYDNILTAKLIHITRQKHGASGLRNSPVELARFLEDSSKVG